MSLSFGLSILRLAPLITSTITLMYGFDHQLFFNAFLETSQSSRTAYFLPHWMKEFVPRAKWIIIFGYFSTLVLAITNQYAQPQSLQTNGAGTWYWCGLAGTLAHFLFAKTAIQSLNRLQDESKSEQSLVELRQWMDMNLRRILVTDLPAWTCYCVAACKVVQSGGI